MHSVPILIAALVATVGCHGIMPPSPDTVLRSFAPIGRFAGHWGVDIATDPGTAVRAIGAGRVTFAGVVVDNRVVTVDHGGGLRTSYSYLAGITVIPGSSVRAGDPVGYSGIHDGAPAFHLSLRIGSRYLDPMSLRACHPSAEPALRLAPPRASRARRRAATESGSAVTRSGVA